MRRSFILVLFALSLVLSAGSISQPSAGGGGGGAGITPLAAYTVTDATSFVVAGGASFDGTAVAAVTYEAVLASTDGVLASHAQLWNLTDNAAVTGCDLTTTSSVSASSSCAIVPGTTAGFPASAKVYEVRVWVASGTGVEFAILHSAHLE